MRLIALALLLAPAAFAQPDCGALFDRAQQAFDDLDTRAADSVAVAATRAAFRRGRACYDALPALDSTGAAHFARLYGRDVQILLETRRTEEAEALTEAFLDGPHLKADSAGVRYLLELRGFILGQQGRAEEAMRTRLQLLDYAPSASPVVRTRIWMALGVDYKQLGRWEEALAIYETVQRTLGAEPELEAGQRVNRARAFTEEANIRLFQQHRPGSVARSLVAARTATHLLREADATRADHYLVFARITLAEAFRASGQPDSALVAAQAAADLAGRLERPSPSAELTGWEEVGRVYLDLERYAEAQAAFERALAVGKQYGVHVRRGALLNQLAIVAMRRGDWARADSLVEQDLHLVEAERAGLGAEAEASRSGFWYDSYLARVSLLLYQHRHEDAFLALDEARARVLRDLRRRRRLLGDLPLATRRHADSLSTALEALHRRSTEPDIDRAERLRLRGKIADLETGYALLFEEDAPSASPGPDRIRRALGAREQVLLTYHLNPPNHAFVLRPDTLIAVPLDAALDAGRIRALMAEANPLWVEAGGLVAAPEAAFDPAPLKTLYDLLVAPVAAHLPAGAALVVVPEGPLAQLPFGLLLEAEPADRFRLAEAPFLLRRHAVSTELAASLLVEDAPPASDTASDLVAFGRSLFGRIEADSPLRSAYGDGAPPDLPNVARELRDLGRRFPSATVALDSAATESRLYASLGRARVLHLASHAFVEDDNPLGSYIQLFPDADGSHDGRLYLYELLQRPLDAALVVLSGCRTARGRDLLGEGVLGLQYAVRAAGAGATLGTLWRVDDAATVELMDSFYAHLARGERKDVALQRAQLAYLETHDGLRGSPFFWAAPVLYGDPSPVDIPSGSNLWWWLGGLVLIAAALLLPRVLHRFPS